MTANNKEDFLFKLHSELHRIGVEDNEDIFADFEEHFRASAQQGYTEEETCARLGDVKEIARSYVDVESTAINSMLANAVENSRPHVSLKKPNRSVPTASQPVQEAQPAQEVQLPVDTAPIREITPEHIAVEPMPAASTTTPRISFAKPAAEPVAQPAAQPAAQPVREVTPQHTAAENTAPNAVPQPASSPVSGSTEPYKAPEVPKPPRTAAQQQPMDTSHMAELPPPTEAEKQGFKFTDIKGRELNVNIGKLITQLCLDLFVYSWALPALASLIIAFIGAAVIGTGGAAIAQFVDGGHFHLLSRIFLGMGLGSLCVLMSCLAITMVKGFIHIIKAIVIAHIKALYDL